MSAPKPRTVALDEWGRIRITDPYSNPNWARAGQFPLVIDQGSKFELVFFWKPGLGGGEILNKTGVHNWVKSNSGTDEYYLDQAGLIEPEDITIGWVSEEDAHKRKQFMPSSFANEGSVGSLKENEWGWGDKDLIGANRLYVRLATTPKDPNLQSEGWIRTNFRDLSAVTVIEMTIRETKTSDTAIAKWTLADSDFSLEVHDTGTPGAAGKFKLSVPHTKTKDLNFTTAYYDLEIEYGGDRIRLMEGQIRLSKELTT